MAFNHANPPPGLSNEIPMMVKFLSLNLLKAFTTPGFSWRHGPHQDAQKSSSTYLPLNEENLTGFPSVSVCSKSGASAPMDVLFRLSIALRMVRAVSVCCKSFDNPASSCNISLGSGVG